jgi:hypothetical protein
MADIKGMIKNPSQVVSDSEEGFSEALKTSLISGTVLGFIVGIQLMAIGLISPLQIITSTLLGTIIGAIGPAMSAVSVHPLIYYFGGRKYEHSYKCFAFLTPISLTGGIIGLNFIGLPASFYLQLKALKQVHKLSWSKTLLSMTAPGIGLTLIGVAVFFGVRMFTPFL